MLLEVRQTRSCLSVLCVCVSFKKCTRQCCCGLVCLTRTSQHRQMQEGLFKLPLAFSKTPNIPVPACCCCLATRLCLEREESRHRCVCISSAESESKHSAASPSPVGSSLTLSTASLPFNGGQYESCLCSASPSDSALGENCAYNHLIHLSAR